jgi:hypothetical protein
MQIEMPTTKTADATILKVYAKTSDCFAASLMDAEGNELKDYDGYVPGFMPGEHYGDYLILDIELATGKILN